MAIKKKSGGGGGGANWMDTYGDMVTLLLCFFVLLYSMSTVSEDKWKALVQSFNPAAVLEPNDPGGHGGPFADPVDSGAPGISDSRSEQEKIDDMMEELLEALQSYASQSGLDNSMSVHESGGRIYLSLSDRAMFYGNLAVMKPGAEEILLDVCGILDKSKGAIEEVRIEGHTAQLSDTEPNATKGDRELASDRATVVTIFIQDHSTIHPARLESVGLGQWHPVGNNQGEEGKAPNRRVEIVISAKEIGSELNEALSKLTAESGGASAQQPQASADPGQSPT